MTDLSPLRALLIKLLASHRDSAAFGDDDSLFKSGRLDSVDVMEIAFFLEETYRLDFAARGIKKEDFDSVNIMRERLIDATR